MTDIKAIIDTLRESSDDSLHQLKKKFVQLRYGVDIDTDYKPFTDEETLDHYEDCRHCLVQIKDDIEALKLHAKINPLTSPLIHLDTLPSLYSREKSYQRLCDSWMEDIKERGLTVCQ